MMRNRFDEQLNVLNSEMIRMGALCEEVIALAAKALDEGDRALAKKVAPLDTQDIEKCYRPLAELEALAAELACGHLSEDDFFELEYTLRQSADAAQKDDAVTVVGCDERFHAYIVDAAGNEYLSELTNTLLLHIRRIKYHYFHLAAMRQASAQQHEEILRALREKDAAKSKTLMREHWLSAMRGCLGETVAYLRSLEELPNTDEIK